MASKHVDADETIEQLILAAKTLGIKHTRADADYTFLPLDEAEQKIQPGDHIMRPMAVMESLKLYGDIIKNGTGKTPASVLKGHVFHHGFCIAPGIIIDFGSENGIQVKTIRQFICKFIFLIRIDYREACLEISQSVNLLGVLNQNVTGANYNGAGFNCEHFATYLKTGKWVAKNDTASTDSHVAFQAPKPSK